MVKPRTFHIADLFCGAGGTSSGATEAAEEAGYDVRLTAVNHWDVAIATHTANHPHARHRQTSVDSVNPRELYSPGELHLLWASPECTHHSVARGGKPIHEQSRATAWCVIKWADALLPPVILVENVPEFLSWGPLGANHRPLKSRKGDTFRAWVEALKSLGYRVEWRILCAADYGDPTTRKRLFVQAVRGRRKIVWPDATHGPAGSDDLFRTLKPWRTAREIIDWTLPGQSIYERKKPLSAKTMRRIMAGLKKFGTGAFLVPGKSGEGRTWSVDRPLYTVTTEARGEALVQPFLVEVAHGNGAEENGDARRIHGVNAPIGAVPCTNRFALAQPFIVPNFGERAGQSPRVHSITEPLPAVTSHGAGALVEPFLVELRGTSERALDATTSLNDPLGTVTAGGVHHALIEPFLVQTAHDGEGRVSSIHSPLPSVCGNRGDFAVCEPHLLPQQSDGVLRPVSQPCPTVATSGAIALVEPIVVTDGKNHYWLDIRFRMLQPHELAGAQGFNPGYIFTGNKTQQVKQIGNAVPCGLSRALVKAVLEEGGF